MVDEGSDSQQQLPPTMTARPEDNKNHHVDSNHSQSTHHNNNTAAHSHGQQHEHSGMTSYYAPPHQRQRWGDTQIKPHTNWGDLFFDVFYVAAAYNLGNMLKDTPSGKGLLYTAGIFFPIMNIWSFKVYYDGRFYYVNDYYHRIYEIFFLCVIATMILHIRSVQIFSHPSEYPDMFIFCLSVSMAFLLASGRYLEIIICCKYFKDYATGLHIEAYQSAIRDFVGYIPPQALLVAATIYSGIQYFSASTPTEIDDSHLSNTNSTYEETNHTGEDVSHRGLADSDTSTYTEYVSDQPDNIPIWLLLGACFSSVAWFLVVVLFFTFKKEKKNNVTVPINVEFQIRRYGEWVMLMLGEGVLSILIVDVVHSADYYFTIVAGLISIILLQYLHYQSQPSDPNLHATRRSLISAFLFYWLMQVYSLALIVFGASYKMLLYEFVYRSYDDEGDGSSRSRGLIFYGLNNHHRFLASGSYSTSLSSQLSTDERQQRDAHFFSGSLSLIFFCLDALSLAHRGIGEQMKRCKEGEMTKVQKLLCWFLVCCRLATIIFVASLSQYVTDPTHIAAIGVTVVITQLCIRFVGYYIFHSASDVEDKALERVIHYNAARIHEHPHGHVTH